MVSERELTFGGLKTAVFGWSSKAGDCKSESEEEILEVHN
jgi:hypothetical protein